MSDSTMQALGRLAEDVLHIQLLDDEDGNALSSRGVGYNPPDLAIPKSANSAPLTPVALELFGSASDQVCGDLCVRLMLEGAVRSLQWIIAKLKKPRASPQP